MPASRPVCAHVCACSLPALPLLATRRSNKAFQCRPRSSSPRGFSRAATVVTCTFGRKSISALSESIESRNIGMSQLNRLSVEIFVSVARQQPAPASKHTLCSPSFLPHLVAGPAPNCCSSDSTASHVEGRGTSAIMLKRSSRPLLFAQRSSFWLTAFELR